MKCLDFDWRIIEFMVYCLTYQFRKSMMASISNKKPHTIAETIWGHILYYSVIKTPFSRSCLRNNFASP